MTKKRVSNNKERETIDTNNMESEAVENKDMKTSAPDTAPSSENAHKSENASDKENEPLSDGSEEKNELDNESKLAEMQDRYLRLSAEFDNYRKRTLREKMELSKTAAEAIMIKLLPVVDDFDRGMALIEASKECDSLKKGIELIYDKFRLFLKQNGIEEIEALDKDFDVDIHEAVTKISVPDESKKGKVVDVIQKGFMLNGKVIRFSKVVVGE